LTRHRSVATMTPMDDSRSFSHNPTPTLDYLHSLKLPEPPKHLEKKVKVTWVGRHGHPAGGPVDALCNDKGQPRVLISCLFKSKLIEEEHPIDRAEAEMNFMINALYSEEGLDHLYDQTS